MNNVKKIQASEEVGIKPKILVLGHGEHGKSETCKYLSKKHGFKFMSSSEAALPYIAPALRTILEVGDDIPLSYLYHRRRHHRSIWKALISLLNCPDKAALSKIILGQGFSYDGMRCIEEFEASRTMFDKIIWVEAFTRKPSDPTMTIEFDCGMIYLDNNKSKEQLFENIDRLVEENFAWATC